MQSRHVSRVIDADPQRVYDVITDPDALPAWAAGLTESAVERDGEDLVVHSPMGKVRVRFQERNPYGVADHEVTLPSGVTVHNPLRVLPHPQGSEVIFTVRQHDLSDEEFARDCATVAADLDRLAELVTARN